MSARGEPKAMVKLKITLPYIVEISIQTTGMRQWSFRNVYGNVIGLGNRIEDFHATKSDGTEVDVQTVTAGEFKTADEVSEYRYKVRLQPADSVSLTHVSWLTSEDGFLMLADLLPQNETSNLLLEVAAPEKWTIETTLTSDRDHFLVNDSGNAVLFIGSALKKSSRNMKGTKFDLVVSGNWPFNESKIADLASKVLHTYLALTGFQLGDASSVMIAPMPFSSSATKWKAETRGSTVVLAIDPQAKFPTWTGQLGVIFTHELLHLWIPNSLKLKGDYDWFFEGFTLYQALLTAFDLKLITTKELLATIARVYDSYLSYPDNRSLLEESERRWTTKGSLVYDKGMLLAFMFDIRLRRHSNLAERYSNVYRKLFDDFAGKQADANQAIIGLLNSFAGMHEFGATFIESKSPLQLEHLLSEFGLDLNTGGQASSLKVKPRLTTDQKRLLHSFGFTN